MGFFSDFFGGKESEVKAYPQARWQRAGIQYLRDLLAKGTPDIPTAPVAGLTPTEQAAQGVLARLVTGGTFEDPLTSPLYQGLRREIEREEQRGVAGLRRGSQLAGMFRSGPSERAEAEYRSGMAARRMGLLGQLYEQERARDNPYTRLAAVSAYGALPRLIEQAGGTAGYESEMQRLMFPYTTQAGLAQALMRQQPNLYMTAPQPSGLTQTIGALSGLANLGLGVGMMGGPLGFGWWGGGAPATLGRLPMPRLPAGM